MKRKMKPVISYIMAITLLMTIFFPALLSAANSDDQIEYVGGTVYYDTTGQQVTASALGQNNSVVSLTKTVKGTDTANEFVIDLKVETSIDITQVKTSADAAVVLILDTSGSMGTPTDHMPTLKSSAINFVDNLAAEAGSSARYISLVAFESDAIIEIGWIDITQTANLNMVKTKINSLSAVGGTFMQGGLQLSRNLLRTDALPNGKDGLPIGNRSVILFTDGEPNYYNATTTYDAYTTGATFEQNGGYGYDSDPTSQQYAQDMANVVKNGGSFQGSQAHNKYDAKLYTIAFGSGSPATWLRNNIATNSSYAYEASNASQLNSAFSAINQQIESWAQAWVVTDPMGENIEFLQNISQNDLSSGLLNFTNNTLQWNLKDASPVSVNNNITTYTYSYRIGLDITANDFDFDKVYDTNKPTLLNYVMVTNGIPGNDVLEGNFLIPKVKAKATEEPKTPKKQKKPQVGKWVKNPEQVIVPLVPKSGY